MFIVRVLDLDNGNDKHFGYTNIEMAKAKVLRERENKRFAWILPFEFLKGVYNAKA